MATQTLTPTTVINLANGVTGARDWQNESDATSDDALYAFSTFDSTATTTKYLYSSAYGFSVPNDGVIKGFTATVQKRASGTAQDHFIGLAYPDGTGVSITFPGKQDGTNWTAGESTSNYGSSNDPWNRMWTPSEVNDTNFGFVISAKGNIGDSPLVDVCKVTVHYNRVYSEVASGGVSGGGDGTTGMVMNVTASGGGVVSRLSTYDVDGSGGSVLGGSSVVYSYYDASVNSNQIAFVCDGEQPTRQAISEGTLHASLSYDALTNVVSWYVNNNIAGVDLITFRQGLPGVDGPLRINVLTASDTVDPYRGSTTVDPTWITEITNGEWYLNVREFAADPDIVLRGQVVSRASLGGAGESTTTMVMNETASGGGVAGSRAFFIFTDDATGGAVINGNGIEGKTVTEIATGGIVAGGQEIHFKLVQFDATGGVELAGLSTTQAIYSTIAAGGGLAGGKIIQGITQHIEPAGVEAGGTTNPFNVNNTVGKGGAVAAGEIRINMFWLHNPVEDGGGVCGGDARKERIRQLQKAIISGIGNSMFSDNILQEIPETEELLLPPTVDEAPDLVDQGYRFETQPTWCFIDPNGANLDTCCALVGNTDVCDASIPRVIEKRQKGHLPPHKRDDTIRDRRIASAQESGAVVN